MRLTTNVHQKEYVHRAVNMPVLVNIAQSFPRWMAPWQARIKDQKIVSNEYFDSGKTDILDDGTKIWRNRGGQIHRIGGPAIEFSDGSREWYVDGLAHREDGPAIDWKSGEKRWFIKGEEMSEREFHDHLSQKKFYHLLNLFGDKEIDIYQFLSQIDTFANNIQLERDPFKSFLQSQINTYQNITQLAPLLHKIPWHILQSLQLNSDLIAEINKSNTSSKPSSIKKFFTSNRTVKIAQHSDADIQAREFMPDGERVSRYADGSTVTNYPDGTVEWHNSRGLLHNDYGPAKLLPSGLRFWFQNGKLHRDDGPAIQGPNVEDYYLYGDQYTKYDYHRYCRNESIESDITDAGGKVVTKEDGTKIWYDADGKYHRDGGPAVIYPKSIRRPNGGTMWYQHGQLHRDDGPAEDEGVYKAWYQHGKQHRDDGPATEFEDGSYGWWKNDQLHRKDGPAAYTKQDDKYEWFQYGSRHRDDGPAIECPKEGHKQWFVRGKELTEDEFKAYRQRLDDQQLLARFYIGNNNPVSLREWLTQTHSFDTLEREWAEQTHSSDNVASDDLLVHLQKTINQDSDPISLAPLLIQKLPWAMLAAMKLSPAIVTAINERMNPQPQKKPMRRFMQSQQTVKPTSIKRVPLPNGGEIETDIDGTQRWLNKHRGLHREDGPALIKPDGETMWCQYNQLHRLDGPAWEKPDGFWEWRCQGNTHRIGGPAKHYPNGREEWYLDGRLHRIGGPAIISPAEDVVAWYLVGLPHRLDGPAVENKGIQSWYINGIQYSKEDFDDKIAEYKEADNKNDFLDRLRLFAQDEITFREWLQGIDKFYDINLLDDAAALAAFQDAINRDTDPETLAPLLVKMPWEILNKLNFSADLVREVNQCLSEKKTKSTFRKFFSTIYAAHEQSITIPVCQPE